MRRCRRGSCRDVGRRGRKQRDLSEVCSEAVRLQDAKGFLVGKALCELVKRVGEQELGGVGWAEEQL